MLGKAVRQFTLLNFPQHSVISQSLGQRINKCHVNPRGLCQTINRNYSQTVQHQECINKGKANYWEEIELPVPWGYIAGKAWGNKNGLPILGLHGWSDSAASFDKLGPELVDYAYFVTIDLPGHGLSSHLPPGANYNYVDFLVTIRRLIKCLNWHEYSIIGHSMGAGLGALYSSIYDSEVKNLVMLDLHKSIPTTMDDCYAGSLLTGIETFLSTEARMIKGTPTHTLEEAVKRWIKGANNNLHEDSAKILMTRGARQVGEDQYEFTRDARLNFTSMMVHRYTNEDLWNILQNIKCRILLLKAKGHTHFEDIDQFEHTVAIYKEKCREFQYTEIEGNHYFHLHNGPETAKYINKFFQST